MARKIGSGMVPLWEVPRSERVEVSWKLSKIFRCWVRSKEAKMVLRLSSWAMRERRFWSWRWELPAWILDMSWSIFGDGQGGALVGGVSLGVLAGIVPEGDAGVEGGA